MENCNTKKKKKKKLKTKIEHPRPIIWTSHSIVSVWKDGTANGVCRCWCQGLGNTASVETCLHGYRLANWSPTIKLHRQIQHSYVLWGTSDEFWKTIVWTPTRILVRCYRCATYITNALIIGMQAVIINVASEYICQSQNMQGSVSKGHAIMTSSMTKSLENEYWYFITFVHEMRQFQ